MKSYYYTTWEAVAAVYLPFTAASRLFRLCPNYFLIRPNVPYLCPLIAPYYAYYFGPAALIRDMR